MQRRQLRTDEYLYVLSILQIMFQRSRKSSEISTLLYFVAFAPDVDEIVIDVLRVELFRDTANSWNVQL